MTWSYTGNPLSNSRDRVRFLIGDTDVNDQLLQDEEIDYVSSLGGDLNIAAALACESIGSRFSRETDMTVGALSRSASQRSAQYFARARELRRIASASAEVFVGGLSISGKETLDDNDDAVQPAFRIGQDDHPGTSLDSVRERSDL